MTNLLDQSRFAEAIAAIDQANSEDPNMIDRDGEARPAELVYAERMTAMLDRIYPDASEALQLAVRAQHLKRWMVPRSTYPDGRKGYLRWRNDLKLRHAELAGEILDRSGYDAEMLARVQSLIRKERLKQDPDSQALEDTACLVFLTHYFATFATKYDDAKLVNILRKTWAKMSAKGQEYALQLQLPDKHRQLIEQALMDE
ncbi:hypothetical protein MnTg02_02744 [bacterium MnTg02]|nr:hypothetical protein MnTg02_02744 [bacterium MnTg02]